MNAIAGPVDRTSPSQAKIALFRSLFRGRDDIYPRRFESRKAGKSGYAPACANEWVRGICEKPRIKCAELRGSDSSGIGPKARWKRDYSGSVRRLVRDGVDTPLATLFVHAARPMASDADGADRARSATEAFLYRRLETLAETKGRFRVNVALPIAFDGVGQLEVDLLCAGSRVAVELDGAQHLADPIAYRRDRKERSAAAGERIPGAAIPC
jgi:very-short-patch-repair endonuclease